MTNDQLALISEPMNKTSTLPPFLEGLNPPQLEAVQHFVGPIVVLAGAGSGKTRVLTHRIVNLIRTHGVRSSSIMAVTFTNKATEEMRHRLIGLLGDEGKEVWVATFHSAALRILRRNATRLSYSNDFVVYDDQDSKSVIKEIVKELNIDDQKFPIDGFARAIDSAKNQLKSPDELAKAAFNVDTQLKAEVYDKYQKKLLASNAMDFGDLLVNAVRVLKEHSDVLEYYRRALQFVLVDEFQDTNKVQYAFIRLVAEPRKNLLVVGDDDQSIYAFRGATIRNILEFEKDYPESKVVKLEQNYRSTGSILEAAHSVIAKNTERKAKKLWTAAGSGDSIGTFIGHDENSEADFIASEIAKRFREGIGYDQIAVLYRTNAQTRALEEALLRFRIPYRIFGGLKFYDRKEIKDILAYLRLLLNSTDDQAFQRVVNTPPRGIGAQTLQSVVDEARSQKQSLLEASFAIAAKSKNIAAFLELMGVLKAAVEVKPLSELIEFVVERTEYGPKLKEMKDPTAQSRIENLKELASIGRSMEFSSPSNVEALRLFLDRVSLTSSGDVAVNEKASEKDKEKIDSVSLMTLHLAKGLEFPVVFLAGVEEGLLPHYRSIDDPTGIEEERRLCYVGITRAMRTLYLTRAHYRGMFSAAGNGGGAGGARLVSRFAKDIPGDRLRDLSTERTPGASFIEGFRYFEDENSDESFGSRRAFSSGRNESRWEGAPSSTSTKMSLEAIKSLLAPADSVVKPTAQPRPPGYENAAPAGADVLVEGVPVYHSSFGKGVVQSREGDSENPKLTIQFEQFEQPKKLVFAFAKLILIG